MTTKEIHDLIQNSDACGFNATGESATKNILNILEQMNNRLGELEARLDQAGKNGKALVKLLDRIIEEEA